MELASEAIVFAVKAHDGMRRKKSDAPYILHPMEVAVIVGTMTDDQELIAAAVLHDTVEDAEIDAEEIEAKFGKRVRALVASETESRQDEESMESTWRVRKESSLAVLRKAEDIGVLMVWLGDKLANLRNIHRDFQTEGDGLWKKFHQQDVSQQAWYYRSILELTACLSDTPAWLEFKMLTEQVFGKGDCA